MLSTEEVMELWNYGIMVMEMKARCHISCQVHVFLELYFPADSVIIEIPAAGRWLQRLNHKGGREIPGIGETGIIRNL